MLRKKLRTMLIDELNIDDRVKIIALVGGGGKTTLMYRLAHELASIGRKVACTTTTHIMKPNANFPFPVFGTPLSDNPKKLKAPSPDVFAEIVSSFDTVIVEADGSRGLPLKLPAEHEPVIPPQTDLVLCIAGLDAIGKPLGEICHRSEIVGNFLGKLYDEPISVDDVARMLPHLAGKHVPSTAKIQPIINKVNTVADKRLAQEIALSLKKYMKGVTLIMTGYPLTAAPHLIIAGGGHVGKATAQIANIIGMKVTVIEHRPQLATAERFPNCHVLCGDYTENLALDFGNNAYYVIVTHGHAADLECLDIIMKKPYRYVGMIGSRKKTAFIMEKMKELGWTEDKLKDVHAPIGLNIGAVTPEEIAVSIMAEIVQVMNANGGEKIPAEVAKALHHVTEPIVLATITKKEGSAPRGAGSCMVIKKDSSIIGTIGGGTVEYRVIQDAVSMLTHHTSIKPADEPVACNVSMENDYTLNDSGGDLNMVCGGKISVKLELIQP